jgi:uncharacterized protein (DUF736 family)
MNFGQTFQPRRKSMNIGEIKKNASGQLIGSVKTIALSLTIGLRPVMSNNPRAPKFDVVVLSASREWVTAGALYELASNKTGEIFYQGRIDDPSMEQPLYIAVFNRDDGSMVVAWQRPRRRNTEIGTSDYREGDMFAAQDAGDEHEDGLGESTAKPPRANRANGKAKTDAAPGTGDTQTEQLPSLEDA